METLKHPESKSQGRETSADSSRDVADGEAIQHKIATYGQVHRGYVVCGFRWHGKISIVG